MHQEKTEAVEIAPKHSPYAMLDVRLMSHNATSIASTLKTRLGLDRQNLKSDCNSIEIYFTSLLIELLTHKLVASP